MFNARGFLFIRTSTADLQLSSIQLLGFFFCDYFSVVYNEAVNSLLTSRFLYGMNKNRTIFELVLLLYMR